MPPHRCSREPVCRAEAPWSSFLFSALCGAVCVTTGQRMAAELELSIIPCSHPQAAYCAYSHGLKGRWLHLARTVPNIGNFLKPLEDTLHQRFIPALTGGPAPSDTKRELLALPARFGASELPIQPQQPKGNTGHPCSCLHPLLRLLPREKLT